MYSSLQFLVLDFVGIRTFSEVWQLVFWRALSLLLIIRDKLWLAVPFETRRIHLKKILAVVLLGIALFIFAFDRPALAADAASGAKVFNANCAACHAGGRNVIMANKTLQKDALEKYGMNSLEAIINQVTNGKNAMPAFKGRLKAEQIEDVSTYVLEQSEKGWS